ncbi:MAG: RES family NAD+ phosphorylase [Chitinophagaceae bacterium]
MRVYRVSNTRYARDLSGEGSRLHGGRWNHFGTSCLYTSQSRPLAVLELSVNISTTSILRYLSMVEIEITDDILDLDMSALPCNWRTAPAPALAKDFGTS